MLYNIMLVDDEAEVRQSILCQIPWEELGFQVTADAENGEDALEKMMTAEPDVIITDIQMPFMTGLEFIEKVREDYPGKEIVIFSGFSEFEYAKQAIRLGVKEYILKPVDKEELTEILKKIKIGLDQKMAQLRDTRSIYENYRKTYSAMKEQFFCDWVNPVKRVANLEEGFQEYGIAGHDADKWLGVFISVRRSRQDSGSAVRLCVEKLLQNILGDSCPYDIFSMDGEIGICFYRKKEQSLKDFLKLMDCVVRDGEKLFGFTLTVGVGSEKYELEQLAVSLCEAREALGYRLIMGRGRTIYIQDVEPDAYKLLTLESEEENELIHAVKFETRQRIEQTVEKLLMKMDVTRVSWHQYQSYVNELLHSLMQLIRQYELDGRRFFAYGENGHEMLRHMKSREEIQEFFTELCIKIRICLEEKRAQDSGKIIRKAKEYVEKNYTNPELSVEMVCEQLNLSQCYFSTVFKKETGQNYVTYVREIRMKKAAELLNRTDDKTYIIAQKVGYTDPYYFSSVFKKTYGMSPSRFRKNG
ncbi:MAG: response regulator [Firmicutes bacterium]|nr:response regulator [Bacillota bacterium]